MFWPEIAEEDLTQLWTPFDARLVNATRQKKGYSGFVFFDVGSVIIDLDWDHFFSALEASLPKGHNYTTPDFIAKLREHNLFKTWSTGKIGNHEYVNIISSVLRSFCHKPEEFEHSILDIKHLDAFILGNVRPAVLEIARKLKQNNFELGILSNSTPWHEILIEKRAQVHDLFDVCIFSQDVGFEKPEPQIYEIAFQTAQRFIQKKHHKTLTPNEVYFIDDLPRNIREAHAQGWNAQLLNLLNDNVLQQFRNQKINSEQLKALSQKKENLLFSHLAAKRVEELLTPLLNG